MNVCCFVYESQALPSLAHFVAHKHTTAERTPPSLTSVNVPIHCIPTPIFMFVLVCVCVCDNLLALCTHIKSYSPNERCNFPL